VSWPVVPLAKALDSAHVFVDGDWVESKDQDPEGDVRLIQLADIGDGYYVDKSNRFLTSDAARRLKCTFLEAGDLLIARMPDPLGRACIFPGDSKRAVTVVDVCIIRPDSNTVYTPWLMHCINSPQSRNQIDEYTTGTTRQRVSRGNLTKIKVALPPLDEQRRIAAILDQAETLRTQRRQALAHLDTLTQSLFLDMFGDPVANPKGIRKAALVEVADISTGSTPGRGGDGYYDGSIPWVKTTEVAGGVIFDTEEKLTDSGLRAIRGKLHPVNSIFVAMYGQGQTRGRCALLGIEAACNQACGVIRPSESFLPSFMFVQLSLAYDRLRALGRGGNQENLNLQLLGSFEVLLPPLALQQTFATRIQAIEALKATHRTALAQLDALFASLQQRAFAGKL
jgi:type I restriction enzyme S subunit